MSKKVFFKQGTKEHDGKIEKNEAILKLMKLYVKNINFTLKNIKIIIRDKGIRYKILQHFISILNKLNVNNSVRLFSHITSKYIFTNKTQILPLIHSLTLSLRN